MPAIDEVLRQGRYRITQKLGQDAVGAGYEAFDNVLQTSVLLKEIFVDLKKTAGLTQTEMREIGFCSAKILTEVKHESLAGVSDYFSEVDREYLVLEVADGDNLSELLEKNKKPFALSEVINWADRLLGAIQYLHTRQPPIFHRDIKPQNIKLTFGGKIKLLVFDVSKKTDAQADTTIMSQMFDRAALPYSPLELIWGRLDRASQNVITNSYDEQSERILNLPPDARSDVYSLGATLYHLLTARIPIDALERSIDILEGKADPLPAASRLNRKIPPEISCVLMKALEIKRENRFNSAPVMRRALRSAVARVAEREAEEAKKQEDILEIPFSEPNKTNSKTRPVEAERLKIEAEQKQQTESIKKQLRESEARRLKAEQRAAEAEQRLIEKETKDSADKKSLAAAGNSAEKSARISPAPIVQPESIKRSVALKNTPDKFKDSFVRPAKDTRIWRRITVAILASAILGGGFFGFQFFQTSKTAELNQIVLEVPDFTAVPAITEPTVEVAPAPDIETASEKTPEITSEDNQMPVTSESPSLTETRNFVETPAKRLTLKNKSAALPAPRIEKPIPALVKTPLKPLKKAVTVDDIINDN